MVIVECVKTIFMPCVSPGYTRHSFIALPLLLAFAGFALKSYSTSLPHIRDIELPSQRFNPSDGETVQIKFISTHEGQAIVRIYDRLSYLVREFSLEHIGGESPVTVEWDGRDESGAIVPNEAYFFTVEVWDQQGRSAEYNPSASNRAPVVPLITRYDSLKKNVSFELSEDSVVDIRAGIADGGPLLMTLVEWKPYLKGRHSIAWDGWDVSKTLHVAKQDKQHLFTQIAPLPENSILTYGNTDLGDQLYSHLVGDNNINLRARESDSKPYSQLDVLPFKEINPEFTFDFGRVTRNKDGLALLRGEVPITIRLNETIQQRVTEVRYEILVFIDNEFVTEIEEGRSPARLLLDMAPLTDGEHWVTVNVVTLQGGLATASQRFIKH